MSTTRTYRPRRADPEGDLQREIVGERAFLGLDVEVGADMSDDELLAGLLE